MIPFYLIDEHPPCGHSWRAITRQSASVYEVTCRMGHQWTASVITRHKDGELRVNISWTKQGEESG